MPVLQLVTCCQVTIKPGVAAAWVSNFLEPPSLSEIREAVKLNLGPGRSSDGTLLDVIDGIDPDQEQRLMRYTPQKEPLILKAYTPSGRTCLGEMRIWKGTDVICRTQIPIGNHDDGPMPATKHPQD